MGTTGVVTEVVTVEEEEDISHTALAEGIFQSQLFNLVHRAHRTHYRGRGRGF